MEYITSKELSNRWKISQRRIIALAKEGRINGAKIYGKTWLFPFDTIKPVNKKEIDKANNTYFRYPNFAFKDINSFNPPLNKEELIIKETFEACIKYDFKSAAIILKDLDRNSTNKYIKITACYIRCMIDINTVNSNSFLYHYNNLRNFFKEDFDHKVEMEEFVHELDATLGLNSYYLNEFKVRSDYNYHPTFLPKLASITTNKLNTIDDRNSLNNLDEFELSLKLLEGSDNYDDIIQIHTNLASAYTLLGRKEEIKFHLIKALDLVQKYQIYFHFCSVYFYMSKSFKEVLSLYPIELQKTIEKISNQQHTNLVKFLNELSLNSFYKYNLSKNFIFIQYALIGLTNKEIAKELNISISNVAKHFAIIYSELNVKNKKEMIDLYNKSTTKLLLNEKDDFLASNQ